MWGGGWRSVRHTWIARLSAEGETTVRDTAGAMKTPGTQVLVSKCHSQIKRKQEVDDLGEELYKVSLWCVMVSKNKQVVKIGGGA